MLVTLPSQKGQRGFKSTGLPYLRTRSVWVLSRWGLCGLGPPPVNWGASDPTPAGVVPTVNGNPTPAGVVPTVNDTLGTSSCVEAGQAESVQMV